MKGFIGLVFVGICVILAAAILVGSLTFPEALEFILGIFWWIIIAFMLCVVAVFIIIIFAIWRD